MTAMAPQPLLTAAVGTALIEICVADITTLDVDAIVNAANRSLLGPLRQMEARVSSRTLYQIPKSRVASIEGRLRSGDVIGIVSRDGRQRPEVNRVCCEGPCGS